MSRIKFFLPFGLFLFSLGYLAFTLTLDSTVMIGDVYGYDPGGTVIPAVSAILLGLSSLLQMIKNRRRGNESNESRVFPTLLVLNIAVSVSFILVFRYAGFLLSTGITLHVLILLNLNTVDGTQNLRSGFYWLPVTILYLTALYTILRRTIKICYFLARRYELPVFREPALQSGLVLIIIIAFLFLGGFLLSRLCRKSSTVTLIQVSVGASLGIYIVFKLLFLVQLPAGLLSW